MTPGDIFLFSRKMTPIETRYETHAKELVAFIKTFETWLHYSEGCKYEVLGYNNPVESFTKSLSFRQTQKARLSWRTLSEMKTPKFFIVYNSC